MRAITITQHSAERSMILDALMPAAPVNARAELLAAAIGIACTTTVRGADGATSGAASSGLAGARARAESV